MNPANAKFVCGAECGLAGTGTASGGIEHWSSASGTASVVTSGPSSMRSTRALRFNPTAGTISLTHTYETSIASPSTTVARFYVYFTTLPSAIVSVFVASSVGLYFTTADNSLRGGSSTAGLASSGIVVTTGQWYRVDLKVVLDTTRTVDLQVDGVAATQYTIAGAAAAATSFVVGLGGTLSTTDMYIDDIVVSGTSGDYPIGAGTVDGLYPNADGTSDSAQPTQRQMDHFWTPNTDFGKGASGATSMGNQNAESTSWQSLANPLSASIGTNWIAGILNASNEWVAWKFDDLPVDADIINGVMGVYTAHAASTTANNIQIQIGSGDGASGAVWSTGAPPAAWQSADMSETTIATNVGVVASANGTAFTPTLVNGIKAKFTSNDVNPDSYLDGICFEVDYVPAVTDDGLIPSRRPYRQLLSL